MKLIVDRIEENIAVVETENKELFNIPASILGDVNEGDRLILTIEKDESESAIDTHSIFERLRNKSKNND